MKQCILHIGMPKTGTSSIQVSLHTGLTDPAFRYCGFGEANGSRAMATLFGAAPELNHVHRKLGWSAQQIEQYRQQMHQRLVTALVEAGDASLILSAESCWRMSSAEFEQIRRFMATYGYTVTVVAYIRPWQPWSESHFQQQVKGGLHTFQVIGANYAVLLDYRKRIETLEAIFDASQVKIFPYAPRNFPEGCVVRHFSHHLGINFDPSRTRRANDSLTLPALQLLYAYRKFGPGYGMGQQALNENQLLIQLLCQLRGATLHFHPSLTDPFLQEFRQQRPWLEQRLGSAFTEELISDDVGVIRTEADLLHFSPEAVAWLAAATRTAPVSPTQGDQAALAISAQMHQLRLIIGRKARFARLLNLGKRKLFQVACLTGRFYGLFQASSMTRQAPSERVQK